MASTEDKENLEPHKSSDLLPRKSSSPSKKVGRRGRSKSIGPGDIDRTPTSKQDAKNRRKSTYVPATKSIISTDVEKAERQAARRRTLANRRVSFAPEATLHTWDVVEFMRDPTTSTDSSGETRRGSNVTRASPGGSPFKRSPGLSLDIDPSSTPPEQADEPKRLPASPAPQRRMHQKERRRSSGDSLIDFDHVDDADSSSVVSGSSDASGSEDEDANESDDETGTAMSLDTGDGTLLSNTGSHSSTASSARLEVALRQAAEAAGTRGIEYDEHGDMSMELAGEEVTNAFKPWAQRVANEPPDSASLDQENINPFSPAFKAQLISGTTHPPSTIEEENTGDISMDVTRAVGSIVQAPPPERSSSPLGDGTMEITQAVGGIQQNKITVSPTTPCGQKRRRSTTSAGSPGVSMTENRSKRRRSSPARSSFGDDTMDLTVAVGGIHSAGSPANVERRKSSAGRRSSGVALEQEEATIELTQAVGGIEAAATMRSEHTSSSFDENEELTMELTTVLGGIKAAEKVNGDALPVTPRTSQSPARATMNTTPKDQERFRDVPDSGPKKLLTPIFQKQVMLSAEKQASSGKKKAKSVSPVVPSRPSVAFAQQTPEAADKLIEARVAKSSLLRGATSLPNEPSLEEQASFRQATPSKSLIRQVEATPNSELKQQLDNQLQEGRPSPLLENNQYSSPMRAISTPNKAAASPDPRKLVDSIKLMSTPRKEKLKSMTPKKQTSAKQASPPRMMTPKARPTPKSAAKPRPSPARQLSEDLLRVQSSSKPVEKIHLHAFLEQAGIRFMDLTTTKRRLTTAPTPSKARRRSSDTNLRVSAEEDPGSTLVSAVVAKACTHPEMEMFSHACHELKHYISDGKREIKKLEAETFRENPPLIQAYQSASMDRRMALDAHMREMKTHARLRSKEMWYVWRSQLLDGLVDAMSGIGEGLIADDEVLRRGERVLEGVLPGLVEQKERLQKEAERLEEANVATSEEERRELEVARERIVEVDAEVEQKKQLIEELRREMEKQEVIANDMLESKAEFIAAIGEADRVRKAYRSVSLDEITSLQESLKTLEEDYGWSIVSASSSPPTVTMKYKSQLQLFFHPTSFQKDDEPGRSRPNGPISLTYIAQDRHQQQQKQLTTTLRFFLQILRASLQALSQSTTPLPSLLNLVSRSWSIALSVAEAERRLAIEGITESRIVNDERLAIDSIILLPKVRTKVKVAFELIAAVVGYEEAGDLELGVKVEPKVSVVYGEQYNEKKMTDVVGESIDGVEGWSGAVRELRQRLVARGVKGGARK